MLQHNQLSVSPLQSALKLILIDLEICLFSLLFVMLDFFRFFLMYLVNKDETEHTGQVSLPFLFCPYMTEK